MTQNMDRMSSTKPYGPNVKMTCWPPLEVVLEAECQALLPGAEAGEDGAPRIGPPAQQCRQGAHQCNGQPA